MKGVSWVLTYLAASTPWLHHLQVGGVLARGPGVDPKHRQIVATNKGELPADLFAVILDKLLGSFGVFQDLCCL